MPSGKRVFIGVCIPAYGMCARPFMYQHSLFVYLRSLLAYGQACCFGNLCEGGSPCANTAYLSMCHILWEKQPAKIWRI